MIDIKQNALEKKKHKKIMRHLSTFARFRKEEKKLSRTINEYPNVARIYKKMTT